MLKNPGLDNKVNRKLMENPNAGLRIIQGFIDEISSGDRALGYTQISLTKELSNIGR